MKNLIIRLMPGFLVKFFARPYVSGDSIDKGISKSEDFWLKRGISSTLDLLAEAVTSREDVEKNVSTYIELIQKIKGKEYLSVSLKPTSLGIHESYEYCRENLHKILHIANESSILITLDMEDHSFTDITLKLYTDLLHEFPTFGTVLQSRLFRTNKDIDKLKDQLIRIRICIGIYKEDASIALTKKSEMKQELIEMTKKLIDNGTFVEVATQDGNTIRQVLELIENHNWTPDQLEFQQLMGVPLQSIQDELLDLGFVVRLYVPFATDWKYAMPYLKRRLVNNPKMGIYVLKHFFGKS